MMPVTRAESLKLGWLGRRLLEAALRRVLGLVENARDRLPITIHFQLRAIKGRVIIDAF